MKRSIVYGVVVLVLVGLGVLLYQDLQQVARSQQNQTQFQQRTKKMTRSGQDPLLRRSKTWSQLSDRNRSALREIGFHPASLSTTNHIQFQLPHLNGDTFHYRHVSNQWILINFWATWCPPCRFEMPSLQQLHDSFNSKRFSVVAVNLQEGPRQIREFVDGMNLQFPVLLDQKGRLANRFYVTGVPETWLIAPGGRPVAKMNGSRDWNADIVLKTIERVIAPSDES